MKFTNSFLKHMEILKRANKYYDHELKRKVKDELYQLDEKVSDEQFMLWSYMDESEDEEVSWNCMHMLAIDLSL